MNESLWTKYREYWVTIGACCVAGALVWWGIAPLYRSVRQKMDRLQELSIDVSVRERLTQSIDSVRKDRERILSENGRFDRVIAKNDIVELIKTIEGLAAETDTVVKIDAIESNAIAKVVPAKTKSPVEKQEETLVEKLPGEQRIPMMLSVTGRYENILHFLRRLESLPYENDVAAMSFSVLEPEEERVSRSAVNVFASQNGNSLSGEANASDDTLERELSLEAKFEMVVYIQE
jgi:hypothetical protein